MALEAPRAAGSFFQHLLQLKREGSLDSLPGYLQAGALEILSLKQVHRELCEATEVLRDATAEAKTQLDQSSLQLQNLLYEQQHYEKEIAGCRAYKSAYPGVVAVLQCQRRSLPGMVALAGALQWHKDVLLGSEMYHFLLVQMRSWSLCR